jgi:hypothetical protein
MLSYASVVERLVLVLGRVTNTRLSLRYHPSKNPNIACYTNKIAEAKPYVVDRSLAEHDNAIVRQKLNCSCQPHHLALQFHLSSERIDYNVGFLDSCWTFMQMQMQRLNWDIIKPRLTADWERHRINIHDRFANNIHLTHNRQFFRLWKKKDMLWKSGQTGSPSKFLRL